jgi:hemerythrin superfamily protein
MPSNFIHYENFDTNAVSKSKNFSGIVSTTKTKFYKPKDTLEITSNRDETKTITTLMHTLIQQVSKWILHNPK